MKKLISLFLIVTLCLVMTACDFLPQKFKDITGGQTVETQPEAKPEAKQDSEIMEFTRTFYSKYNSYSNVPVDVSYEILTLEDESLEKYPQVKNAFNNIISENNKNCLEMFDDLNRSANEFSSMADMHLYTHSNVFVRRADSKILSLIFSTESYAGGAHGSHYFDGRSIDVESGRELTLGDITTDKKAFSEVIYKKLMEQYEPQVFFDADAIDEHIFEQFDSLTWVADYSGITIIFNHYEIAPYASGNQIVTIPFDEIPGLNKNQYKDAPKSYMVELAPYSNYYFSLDNDGELNAINVSGSISSLYGPEPVKLYIDDAEITITDYSYSSRPVLVHMDSGENYLYTQIGIDESEEILIHKLTSFGAKNTDVFYGNTRYTYDINSEVGSQKVLTNPHKFELAKYTAVISTVYAYRSYFVNESGSPQAFDNDKMSYVDNNWGTKFTLLRPLKVDIIDPESEKVKETKTLSEGEELEYYRTDEETVCDLKLNNGEVARIEIDDAESWPRTINGVDIHEIFEGLMFAG